MSLAPESQPSLERVIGVRALAANTINLTVGAGIFVLPAVGAATLVLFFAFGGTESAVTPSGEIRDPARTIPRGLLLGILGIASLYIAIQIVAQGVLGAELPEHSGAPLAATAERLIGPSGIVILLAAAAISMLATLGGDLLATPRALFASARDGILPRRLASIHPRFHTPFLAIGLYAALGFILAVSGVFETLATLSSVAILLVYLATAAATLELRRRDVRATPAVFRLIGGPLIPLIAAAVIVWLLSLARREEWLSIAVLVAVAAAFYALRRPGRRLGRQPD